MVVCVRTVLKISRRRRKNNGDNSKCGVGHFKHAPRGSQGKTSIILKSKQKINWVFSNWFKRFNVSSTKPSHHFSESLDQSAVIRSHPEPPPLTICNPITVTVVHFWKYMGRIPLHPLAWLIKSRVFPPPNYLKTQSMNDVKLGS